MSILCGRYVCVCRRGAWIKNAQHFCLLMCLGLGIFLALKVAQRRMRMRMWTIWKVRGASLSVSHCSGSALSRANTHTHACTETHTHTRPWSRLESKANWTAAAAATAAEAATQVLRPYPKLVAKRTLQPIQPWLWARACPWCREPCEIGKLSSDQARPATQLKYIFVGKQFCPMQFQKLCTHENSRWAKRAGPGTAWRSTPDEISTRYELKQCARQTKLGKD